MYLSIFVRVAKKSGGISMIMLSIYHVSIVVHNLNLSASGIFYSQCAFKNVDYFLLIFSSWRMMPTEANFKVMAKIKF